MLHYYISLLCFQEFLNLLIFSAFHPPPISKFEIAQAADAPTLPDEKESLHGFEVNSDKIARPDLLDKLCIRIDNLLKTDSLRRMTVKGTSSVDGPVALNNRLALERAQAVAAYIAEHSALSPKNIKAVSGGENWDDLLEIASNDLNLPMRDEVLEILESSRSVDSKENALRRLGGGKVWKYLVENVFPATRKTVISMEWAQAKAIETVISDSADEEPQPQQPEEIPVAEAPVETVEIVETVVETPQDTVAIVQETFIEQPVMNAADSVPVSIPDTFIKKLYLKTNAPAWLMLWTNLAIEADIAPHWSAQLPVYYSGFNYFRHTVKFRTFALVPELRWWTKDDNTGFFVNVHAGLAWYNYAKGGDFRYQDHHRKTPAIGGGVGIGYRFYFCKNRRWTMEAAIGAGIYRLDYDIFQNRHNGLIVGREKRTFYGIDQAALSFSYSFGLKKKGGDR